MRGTGDAVVFPWTRHLWLIDCSAFGPAGADIAERATVLVFGIMRRQPREQQVRSDHALPFPGRLFDAAETSSRGAGRIFGLAA